MTEKCQCPPEAGAGTCQLVNADPAASCPACSRTGTPVNVLILKALLAVSLTEVREVDYRFCRTRDCGVIYYSADQQERFSEQDVRELVFQKHPSEDDVFVCYCFRHTVRSIRRDAATPGSGTVVAAITAGIQDRQCACDIRNPQGSCCLGNVRAVIASVAPAQLLREAGIAQADGGGQP